MKKKTLLEANNLAKKELISSLVTSLVLVSLLYRLANCQWIVLIYSNLWQVSQVFLQWATPWICYRNLGKKVQLIYWFSQCFFFFLLFELCITMYLRKFTLPSISSHNDITCFLVHWLGNFSTTSLNQTSSLLSLNTFKYSHNKKCQSTQTVFCFLKLNQVHAWFKMCRKRINSSLKRPLNYYYYY